MHISMTTDTLAAQVDTYDKCIQVPMRPRMVSRFIQTKDPIKSIGMLLFVGGLVHKRHFIKPHARAVSTADVCEYRRDTDKVCNCNLPLKRCMTVQ